MDDNLTLTILNLSVIPFLVDYEAIMEERKRIADEEERKRKEHELKVTTRISASKIVDNLLIKNLRLTTPLLYKPSFDHTRFEKCFVKRQRKPKKAARRKKVDFYKCKSFEFLTALQKFYRLYWSLFFQYNIFLNVVFECFLNSLFE